MSRPRPRRLTAAFVRNIQEIGVYGDGRGGLGLAMHVRVYADGDGVRKTWTQRLTINGRATNVGLGGFPVVGLAEAQKKALENWRAAEAGEDPRRRKRTPTGTVVAVGSDVPTFAEAAESVIALHAEGWRDGGRSASIWRSSLKRFAYPVIGAKPVSDITAADVLAVLSPHWTSKRETMRRLKGRIAAVMAWAIAEGHRDDDPTATIVKALPRNGATVEHHRALPHGDVAVAMATVAASGAWAGTKLGLAFLTLTATRSGEVRGARWSEIDRDAAVWTIPGDRAKTGRPHRVPLSPQALAVLDEAEALSDAAGLIFASPTGRPLSDSTWSKLLRENGIAAVPHGMRSSFRDFCGETGVPREVAEAALGHVAEQVERAYARSDLLERRRVVMADWGSYITG